MTRSKARILSSISTDIAQVLFGAIIAAIVLPLDSNKLLIVTFELLFSVAFWIFALLFGERGKV